MTKKIFAMFLAVLMVVSMLPASVLAADVTTCPGEGKHTAENCPNTLIGTVEPTCNKDGFSAYKCNVCGEEFHDKVTKATGLHDFVDAEDTDPTCELPGSKGGQVCSNPGCGLRINNTVVLSLSQQAGKVYNCQWEISNPQVNCLTGGEQVWKCVNEGCHAEKTVTVEKKSAHSWGDFELITAATASANGLAKRVCEDCTLVDEVVVYYAHNCKDYLVAVTGYPKTCTSNGLANHKECRICGAKWNAAGTAALNATQIAALTIPASHTFAVTPTCADTLLQCTVATCKQWVNPGVAHDIDWVVTDAEKAKDSKVEEVLPTCLKPGYIYDLCSKCNVRHLKTLEALTHLTVTVDVPATCSTYAYSITYCTRNGCTDATVTEANNTDYALAVADTRYNLNVHKFVYNETAPVIGTGYYMALNHLAKETVLYFIGEGDGKYLKTSRDARDAVKVYVEKIHHLDTTGELLMYFYDDNNVKTYIEIYKPTSDSPKVRLTTTRPTSGYKWNSEKKVLAATISGENYFLNCYINNGTTYETIGVSKISFAPATEASANTTFRASLVSVNENAKLHIIAFSMNKTAGWNSSVHVKWTEGVVATPATCTTNGKKIINCEYCGVPAEEVIYAAHSWEDATANQVPVEGEAPSRAVGCNDGWQWQICSVPGCNATQKLVYTGSGHVYNSVVPFVPNHINTVGYDTKTCKYCPEGTEGHVVNVTYKTWPYIGVQFDSLTAAQAAHGSSNVTGTGTVLTTGDCTTYGLTKYTCAGCSKDVYVKTEGKHLAPESIGDLPVHKDATCTEPGWDLSYKCLREGCGQKVGAAAIGEKNVISALGHSHQPVSHTHNACNSPNYNTNHLKCNRSGCTDPYVKCFVKNNEITVWANSGADLCTKTIIEYYWCEKCQDEHIRGFVEAMGHDWKIIVNEDGETNYSLEGAKAPTCTESGVYFVECSVCGTQESRVEAPVAHENEAEEKFFNKCNDPVVDRHCKNCCTCGNKSDDHDCTADQNKNVPGVQPCDCVIPTEHQYNAVKMPSSCTMPPYLAKTCADCGKRTNEVLTEVEIEGVMEDVIFYGHKPAAIDMVPELDEDGKLTGQMVPAKYPGYTYDEEFVYTYYTLDENGNYVKHEDAYTAKFIERKAASYSEEGYDRFICQICNAEHTKTIDKLPGLGFELTVQNANGQDELTFGSKVSVIVSANALEEEIYSFNFDVIFSAMNYEEEINVDELLYVGYETLNPNFYLTVTNPDKVNKEYAPAAGAGEPRYLASWIKITGKAFNDENNKMQNVVITGNTPLVRLDFIVLMTDACYDDDAPELGFFCAGVEDDPEAYTVVDDDFEVLDCSYAEAYADTVTYMDINRDGFFHMTDLNYGEKLVTGERADGKIYDVSLDVNKDGELAPEELTIAYGYYVGNWDEMDLFFMGVSEEEAALVKALMGLNHGTEVCSKCGYVDENPQTACPQCGNWY